MVSAKRFTRRLLESLGILQPYVCPEEAAYERIVAKGFKPAGIIDVGAYQGEWTRLARRIFGDMPVLMIEAQKGKKPFLDRVCADLAGVSYVNAVMGRTAGETVTFYEMETGSSMFPEQSDARRTARTLSTRTLDDVASGVPAPLFLKIDVQGAELEVLAGGSETLSRADLVQLEVALLPYNEGAPTILDVLPFMKTHGLVPFDLSGWSRPNGIDLAQIDLLFVREDSPLRLKFFNFK